MEEGTLVAQVNGSDGKIIRCFSDHKKLVDYFLKNQKSISRVILIFGQHDKSSMDRKEFISFLKSMTPVGGELKIPPPKEFVGNFLFTRSHQLLGMG